MSTANLHTLLGMTFRAVTEDVHTRLAAAGFADLRPAHGYIFQFLSHRTNATAVQLAAHLGVTKQAAVQLIDELQSRGYVRRQPHPTDRRSRAVLLTEQGWAAINAVVDAWQHIEREWAGLIGDDALRQLLAGLTAYVARAAGERPVTLRPVW